MKNIFTLLAFCFAISSFINAEEVSIESDGSVAEFNYVSVTDPMTFMQSLDKFDKSKCAAKWREESGVNVSLWSLRGSGSSHFILVNYENWDMMEKGRAVFTACPAAAMMLKSFQTSTDTDRSWNWVSENALSGRNWQSNTVFRKINFKVDEGHAGHYASAWKKLVEAQLDNIPGSFGLNAISYGNRYSSHMVYLGADSMSELSEGFTKITSSKDFAEFFESTGDIRTIVNTELVQLVKNYEGK